MSICVKLHSQVGHIINTVLRFLLLLYQIEIMRNCEYISVGFLLYFYKIPLLVQRATGGRKSFHKSKREQTILHLQLVKNINTYKEIEDTI